MIEEFRRSGQVRTEFCRARGLDVTRFYYWSRVLAQGDQANQAPGQFVLLNRAVSPPDGEAGAAVEVVAADG